MKNIRLILPSLVLLFLFSCKKDVPVVEDITPDIVNSDITAEPSFKNSVSFTVAGKLYEGSEINNFGMGNLETNVQFIPEKKADQEGKSQSYWTSAKDSLQYFRSFHFIIGQDRSSLELNFIKNYKKTELIRRNGHVYIPNDFTALFSTGMRNYATDFQKEGKLEGIAMAFSNSSVSSLPLQSYSPFFLSDKSSVGALDQKNSSFVITKLEKLKEDYYLLEATFEANVYDKEAKPVRIEKGFLRLKLWSDSALF